MLEVVEVVQDLCHFEVVLQAAGELQSRVVRAGAATRTWSPSLFIQGAGFVVLWITANSSVIRGVELFLNYQH